MGCSRVQNRQSPFLIAFTLYLNDKEQIDCKSYCKSYKNLKQDKEIKVARGCNFK